MKILVIGGTYFLGKHFVEQTMEKNEIVMINRGSKSIPKKMKEQMKIYVGDRHDEKILESIEETYFDAVVDFCAYKKGDIQFICDHVKADIRRYIFISTCDVYKRGMNKYLKENAPLEDRDLGGMAGDYISGKVSLEREIAKACEKRNCSYTVLRPAFIFGPDNYAPRESIYFTWIKNAGQIIHPIDATGEFQLIYVEDVVKAIILACEDTENKNCAYNLCGSEMYTYEKWAQLLLDITPKPFQKVEVSVELVLEKNIPLPFPLYKEESNWYDGTCIENTGFSYSDVNAAMAETMMKYL